MEVRASCCSCQDGPVNPDLLRDKDVTIKILIVDDETDMELLVRQRFRKQIREGGRKRDG